MMLSNLYMQHDADLEDHPEILAARTRGASLVRLTMARMYGHPNAATSNMWQIVPHVTERDTIGVVDVALGTAWDSMVEATDDVAALGLDDSHTPDANHPSLGGDATIDGEVVQRRGQDAQAAITAPPGWRRIGLPPWRGYGDGRNPEVDPRRYRPVPADLYESTNLIRPRLRAIGLMTCYGRTGEPRTMLADAHGWQKSCPDWVHPDRQPWDLGQMPLPAEVETELADAARAYVQDVLLHITRSEPWHDDIRAAVDAGDRKTANAIANEVPDDASITAVCRVTHGEIYTAVLPRDARAAGRVLRSRGQELDRISGLGWYGILLDSLCRATLERTAAARAEMAAALKSAGGERNVYLSYRDVMTPLVSQVADWLLDGAPDYFDEQARSILYRGGPLYVDMPADTLYGL